MEYISPFSVLDAPRVSSWLSENGFAPRFSRAHRLYYSFLRPFLPIRWRQAIQRRHWLRIRPLPDFVDPEMVHWVQTTDHGRRIINHLYPKPFRFVYTLTHDVETAEGLARVPEIIRLEQRFGIRSSWNIVPFKYPVDEGVLRDIRAAGHEIGVHGFNHDGRLFVSHREFDLRARRINEILDRWGAVGFRAPMVHRQLEWMQALNVFYDASCFDYDVYQPFPGGVRSIWPFIAGKFVELPYTLPQDHTVFIVLNHRDATLWKRKTEWLIRNHGVVLLVTHPDYLDRPERLNIYADFLHFLTNQDGGWHLLPRELAAFWHEHWGRADRSNLRQTIERSE